MVKHVVSLDNFRALCFFLFAETADTRSFYPVTGLELVNKESILETGIVSPLLQVLTKYDLFFIIPEMSSLVYLFSYNLDCLWEYNISERFRRDYHSCGQRRRFMLLKVVQSDQAKSTQAPLSTVCCNTPKKQPSCHRCELQLEAFQTRYLGNTGISSQTRPSFIPLSLKEATPQSTNWHHAKSACFMHFSYPRSHTNSVLVVNANNPRVVPKCLMKKVR
jgi:hypothetical protein